MPTTVLQPDLIDPHGGVLVDRRADAAETKRLRAIAPSLPALTVGPRTLGDLEMLAVGGYSPLRGFFGEADYRSVVQGMHLSSGLPWPIPITLSADAEFAARLRAGQEVALTTAAGEPVAILHFAEAYPYDKRTEARLVYRTEEEAHPGVAALFGQGDLLLAGAVTVLPLPQQPELASYRLDPAAARAGFRERGWRWVVGFQTRNPVHRAHEYIQKCALEMVDGLFLHPLVGETKADDLPAEVRLRCYEALLAGYYPRDRVLLGVLPAPMRYAGPREAILHALIRKNYGCSHFIVGRDHAGVGHYYGPYDAQRIFAEFDPGALGVTPLFFENSFYCRRCGGMASNKTCPHDPEAHVVLSGTRVRDLLAAGQPLPAEFSRPEVAAILLAAARLNGSG